MRESSVFMSLEGCKLVDSVPESRLDEPPLASNLFPLLIPLVTPCFRQMRTRVAALEVELQIVRITPEEPNAELSARDVLTVDSVMSCLDLAESITKMIPIVGSILEGACGTIRKVLVVAQARARCQAGTYAYVRSLECQV